jgi:hypothetical protein
VALRLGGAMNKVQDQVSPDNQCHTDVTL